MATNNADVAGIIAANGQWIADSANALRQSQWASAASAAQNEKEQAEYMKIAESGKYIFTQEGAAVALSEQENETSPFMEIIEGGMGAPSAGGSGGIVTNPDGSTYMSSVPHQLWGTPLPEYAKAPNPVSDGIQTMLQSLVPGWVDEVAAGSKSEIAALFKEDIVSQISSSIG